MYRLHFFDQIRQIFDIRLSLESKNFLLITLGMITIGLIKQRESPC